MRVESSSITMFWSVWIPSLLCILFFLFFFCLKVLGRTKHLAPDTSRPVTHLVDRPGDIGKDRWMENSMAGRREERGGQIL